MERRPGFWPGSLDATLEGGERHDTCDRERRIDTPKTLKTRPNLVLIDTRHQISWVGTAKTPPGPCTRTLFPLHSPSIQAFGGNGRGCCKEGMSAPTTVWTCGANARVAGISPPAAHVRLRRRYQFRAVTKAVPGGTRPSRDPAVWPNSVRSQAAKLRDAHEMPHVEHHVPELGDESFGPKNPCGPMKVVALSSVVPPMDP